MAPKEPPPRRLTAGAPDQGKPPTNIDRRKCHRVVPMEVMSFGLSRTGTASTRQALIDLGYDDCYHYVAAYVENPPDAGMWADAIEAKFNGVGKPFKKAEWDQLLGHCMAVTDAPCVFFWEELYQAYPDAKIILTVRDSADIWADSIKTSLKEPFIDGLYPNNGWYERLLRLFYPTSLRMQRYEQALATLTPMWQSIRAGKEASKRFYEEHNAAVKKAVPEDNLLVFNVKQGWAPLCQFLGKEIPPWDFPKNHERELFRTFFMGFVTYCRGVAERRLRWTLSALAGGIAVVGFAAYYRPGLFGSPAHLRRFIRW